MSLGDKDLYGRPTLTLPLPSKDLLEVDAEGEEPPRNATKAPERARYGEVIKADDGKLKTPDDTPPGSFLHSSRFPPSTPASGGKACRQSEVVTTDQREPDAERSLDVHQRLIDLATNQAYDALFPRAEFEQALAVLKSDNWELWNILTEKRRLTHRWHEEVGIADENVGSIESRSLYTFACHCCRTMS